MGERDTPRRTGGFDFVESYDVAAGGTIGTGKLVALDANGDAREYARTASGTANELIVLGRCEETADNSAGAAGDVKVSVRTGVFRWDNDTAANTVTKANVGDAVYGEDDGTIRDDEATEGGEATAAKVGLLMAVDDLGAWVATGIPFLH